MHKGTAMCAMVVLCMCTCHASEEIEYRYTRDRDLPILIRHVNNLLGTLMERGEKKITRTGAIEIVSENAFEYWSILSNPSTPNDNLITGAVLLHRKVKRIGTDEIEAALESIRDRLPTFNDAVHAIIKAAALDAHINYLDNDRQAGESLWKQAGVFRIRVVIGVKNKEALVALQIQLRDIAAQGLIDLSKDLSSAYERRKKGENQKTFFDELAAVYLSGEQLKADGK